MWNKEHEIYGYHLYREGKPEITGGKFNPVIKATVLTVVIPAKEGGLVESVAIARETRDSNKWFIRARAVVNEQEDKSKATKARGRQIATERIIAMINYLGDREETGKKNPPRGVSVLSYEELTDREKTIFEKHGKAGE